MFDTAKALLRDRRVDPSASGNRALLETTLNLLCHPHDSDKCLRSQQCPLGEIIVLLFHDKRVQESLICESIENGFFERKMITDYYLHYIGTGHAHLAYVEFYCVSRSYKNCLKLTDHTEIKNILSKRVRNQDIVTMILEFAMTQILYTLKRCLRSLEEQYNALTPFLV